MNWRRATALGVGAWLLPFVVAVAAFALRDAMRPLFESIMAVAVSASAVVLGVLYQRGGSSNHTVRQSVQTGLLWFVMCIAIDVPLLQFGPLDATFGEYASDIGLTYVIYPVVMWGLGHAASGSNASR